MVAHTFKPNTWQAEAGLVYKASSRIAWAIIYRNSIKEKKRKGLPYLILNVFWAEDVLGSVPRIISHTCNPNIQG